MSQTNFGAPGLGLAYPQALVPAILAGAPFQPATNELTLSPGQAIVIPPGPFMVTTGRYTIIQYLDPVTGAWYPIRAAQMQPTQINSDGQNYRVINITGIPVGGVVTAAGSGYSQSTTTCTASAGGSTWQPIIGGQVSATTSVTAAGSGYTLPPQVIIPAPPSPGVPATGYASISSGTVSGITLTNQGAGYTTAPVPLLVPSPFDPNLGNIVNATGKLTLTGSGTLTAVICTNNGAPQSSAPTLTISGAGTSATATALLCQTGTSLSLSGTGAGYSNATYITSIGGAGAASNTFSSPGNPNTENSIVLPRQLSATVTQSGGSLTVGSILDGGIFLAAPTPVVVTGAVATTAATVALTLGSVNDTVWLQAC